MRLGRRYPLGELYISAWDGGSLPQQWARLGELVAERKPRSIGINTSEHWAFGDGLSHGLYESVKRSVGDVPLVSAEQRVRYLGGRQTRWHLVR